MKIFLQTFGCTFNRADSMIMKAYLKGHKFVDSADEADVIIVNSCAVKLTTENKMVSLVEKYKKMGKKVVLAGCLPRVNKKRSLELGVSVIDVNSLDKIREAVESSERKIFFSENKLNKMKCPHLQDNSVTAVVELSEGCLGNCSFCGTKNSRGSLKSYSPESIFDYVKDLVSLGKKEILMTSQDNGCYGYDIGTSLPELVKKITTEIKGEYLIRVGMANPHFVYDDKEAWAEMLNNEKVFKFVHLPIQSGSNKILKSMNRVGAAEQFEELVDYLRSRVPGLSVMTDIIVGFPGETDEDFQRTVQLIEKTKPDVTNISMFYPRPHTKAVSMKKVPTSVSKDRTRMLTHLCEKISLENNEKMEGKEVDCLVTDTLKDGKKHARSYNYKQVIFSGEAEGFVRVKIEKAAPGYLIGNLIK